MLERLNMRKILSIKETREVIKTPVLGMLEGKGSVRAEKTEIPNKHEIDKMIGKQHNKRGI